MPQLQLGLGQVNSGGTGTSRQQAPVGQGLQDIGQALAQYHKVLTSNQGEENPVVSMNAYVAQKRILDAGTNKLKKIQDPEVLDEQADIFFKEFTKQSGEQLTQLGVPKSGTQKLTPAIASSMDDVAKYRSHLLGSIGSTKLEEQRAQLRNTLGSSGVYLKKRTTEIGADGVGGKTIPLPPVITFMNQENITADLVAFNTTTWELASKYQLDPLQVQQSLEKDQQAVFQEMITNATNQIPGHLISPEYKGMDFSVEQVFIDPSTGQIKTVTKTLTPSETEAMKKVAYSNLSNQHTQAEYEKRRIEEVEKNEDYKLEGDLLAQFGDMPVDVMLENVATEQPGFTFHTNEARKRMLSTLYDVKKAGGFARSDKEGVVRDLDERLMSGEAIPPEELYRSVQGLSQGTFNRLRDTLISNQRNEKSEFQREVNTQQKFIDEFLGNMQFVKSQGETADLVASITKEMFRSRVRALPPEKQTPENLNVIARESILANSSRLFQDVGFKTRFQVIDRLSKYNSTEEIDAAAKGKLDPLLKTREDVLLAKDLLKFKQLSLDGKASSQTVTVPKKKVHTLTEDFQDLIRGAQDWWNNKEGGK